MLRSRSGSKSSTAAATRATSAGVTLAGSATAFTLLRWVGAAYLMWLGLAMLLGRGSPARPRHDGGTALPWRRVFAQGFLTNALNPKVALFFLAFLPQFIPAQLSDKLPAFLLLGALFVLQGLLFLLAVVGLTARLARMQALAGSGWSGVWVTKITASTLSGSQSSFWSRCRAAVKQRSAVVWSGADQWRVSTPIILTTSATAWSPRVSAITALGTGAPATAQTTPRRATPDRA